MPNMDPQVLAQMLRSRAGSAVTPAEMNSFLSTQPTPSMAYMNQMAGSALTPAEMARMQAQQQMMQPQTGAALTPYEQQQLAMQQAQFSGR